MALDRFLAHAPWCTLFPHQHLGLGEFVYAFEDNFIISI